MLERLIDGFAYAVGAFVGLCACGAAILLIGTLITIINDLLTGHSREGKNDD